MKKLFFVTILTAFTTVQFIAQPGWFNSATITTNDPYYIQMLNANTGYVTGSNINTQVGVIYKTTDGGYDWILKDSSGYFCIIYFLNVLTGYAADRGRIRQTTDGGSSWVNVFYNPAYHFGSIGGMLFLNTQTGFVSGATSQNTLLLKTNNGCISWDTIVVGTTPNNLINLQFINSQTGYGASGIYIYKTFNGGNNWTGFPTSIPYPIRSSFFIDSNTGYAGGYQGRMIKTTNGCNNWIELPVINSSYSHITMYFADASTGFVSGNAPILKTTNGGLNWVNQLQSGYSGRCFSFVNSTTGFLVCSGGKIYKTTNGGDPLGIIKTGAVIPQNYLYQNYPNPFNPNTKIKFDLKNRVFVQLSVFNVTGQEIIKLVEQILAPGTYEVDFKGTDLMSGVYYYKLTADDYSLSRKMVILK